VPELNDLQTFAEDEMKGVRLAVKAFKTFMDNTVTRISAELSEEWLAHIIHMEGACDCDLSYDWDGGYDADFCSWYKQLENRVAWLCYWYEMTQEELQQKRVKEEAERRQRIRARAEADRTYRLNQLYALAKEFGVNPELLP